MHHTEWSDKQPDKAGAGGLKSGEAHNTQLPRAAETLPVEERQEREEEHRRQDGHHHRGDGSCQAVQNFIVVARNGPQTSQSNCKQHHQQHVRNAVHQVEDRGLPWVEPHLRVQGCDKDAEKVDQLDRRHVGHRHGGQGEEGPAREENEAKPPNVRSEAENEEADATLDGLARPAGCTPGSKEAPGKEGAAQGKDTGAHNLHQSVLP